MADFRQTKNVTIKDVARVAGVSTQTVSRVINDRPDVARDTRSRVLEIISELGYSPNVIAKSLSSGRSNTLGVIGFGLEYYGSTSVLRGIEKKANALGFSIIVSLLDDYEMDRVDQILRELLSRQVEGVLWSIPGIGKTLEGLSNKFADAGIPVVFLNKEQTGNNMVVALDNRLGGLMATRHLLEQGYQHIGLVTGPAGWWEASQREVGWREAMQQAGVTDLDNLVAEGNWSPASGEAALYHLMEKSPHVDAVFVSNDQMALGVLRAARQLGLRVPQDLGVVGFDDIPEAAYFYPALTTMQQNARKLGALAVEKLHDHIRGHNSGEATETSWVKPRLIVRESSIPDND
jgi:LacI family transcriptional regulator